jgi:hypothetical protein
MKSTNSFCGQSPELRIVKADGTYNYLWALYGQKKVFSGYQNENRLV